MRGEVRRQCPQMTSLEEKGQPELGIVVRLPSQRLTAGPRRLPTRLLPGSSAFIHRTESCRTLNRANSHCVTRQSEGACFGVRHDWVMVFLVGFFFGGGGGGRGQ